MTSDIIGKFMGLALAFVLLIVAPFVERSAQIESLDSRAAIADVTNFIDSVVDSRHITDSMLKELNSKLASYSILFDYEITREMRVVDYDPSNKNTKTATYWIVADDNRNYLQGDHITVRIFKVGHSSSSMVSSRLASIFIPDLDYTFSARVR